jgi:hypothetical protein
MSKKNGIKRTPNKKNLGLGRSAEYAAKVALRQMFGRDDHYCTKFVHHSRFLHFIGWLSKLDPVVKDLRQVTLSHAQAYGKELAKSVKDDEMAVSYGQNLISTLNVVMHAVRLDEEIWLSPSKIVGTRSYIRTALPDATWEKTNLAVRLAENQGNHRGAAFILLERAFGMRAQEAALANLHRLKAELDLNGAVFVLDGTKGGFKSTDRKIKIESDQRHALEYALNVISKSGVCLVDTNTSYREFLHRCINPVRPLLKEAGIRCPRDLRAERFIDVYEQESGQLAPMKQKGPFDREADNKGRQKVSHEGGHKRLRISSSYVGKRHRTNLDKSEAIE